MVEVFKESPTGRARVQNAERRQAEHIVNQLDRNDEIPARNDRESKLDHDELGGCQFRHEDEVGDEHVASRDDDEAMYDLFAGNVAENYEYEE